MSQNTLWGASGKCSGPPVIYVISNMICMIFNMPYMTISIDIQYIVRRGEKFDPNCSICDLIFVPGVRLKTRRLGLLKHLFLIAIQQIALIMI